MGRFIEKPVDGTVGLTYEAWPSKLLRKNPITKKHIGDKVWVAGHSKRETSILISIHQPGDPQWPRGGYTVQHKGQDYRNHYFPDAVRAHPPKKKKARSQLARNIKKGKADAPAIPEEYWNPPQIKEGDVEVPTLHSTDLTAVSAKEHIQQHDLDELEDFVPEEETRVTVQRAWEEKHQEARDKVSTDMNAADAAKYIRDTSLKNLLGFVPEDETRKTVTSAWEKKQETK